MGPFIPANRVKFGDSCIYVSRDIRPEAVRGGIFDRSLNFDNCQLEVVSDVISGMVNQDVSMDVCAHFCDSRLKPSDLLFWPFFESR